MKQFDPWVAVDETLEEMVEAQRKNLLANGRRIVPTLTPEDMLQPNDYPELDNHPDFRYEEGILAGMLSAQSALRALHRDHLYALNECEKD